MQLPFLMMTTIPRTSMSEEYDKKGCLLASIFMFCALATGFTMGVLVGIIIS